jgi:hopene-associated glycosyltransferase HpnB
MLFALTGLGAIALASWIYLALGHGSFWRPLLPVTETPSRHLPSVDIVIPARDEANVLPYSLPSLLTQDYKGDWRVILVDDHSTDGTSEVARQIADQVARHDYGDRLTVVQAPDLAPGWAGKVAAMQAGVQASRADMILFTDADIRHSPVSLSHLVARAEAKRLDLVSRMVMLNCVSFAEKLLIPSFIFFFAKLYPFRRSNNPDSRMAAAAGGTMLMRRTMLNKIGGLASIQGALIDDCGLAKEVKQAGGRTELTLTRDIESLRPYPHIRDVWKMVSRTAYTQLRHSPLLLVGTVISMAILYVLPPLLFLLAPSPNALGLGLLTWLLMTALYLPMVRFYGLGRAWALTLPMAALVYGAATIDSARLYRQGKGGQWKGRAQDSRD